ncbi:MAG: hypothetical protein NT069_27135 [Planctomycetota bacterium]|nr:hypothetical protein [Planctomycetota bacterium]
MTKRPPAISGVSASSEAEIQTVYPSIAATSIGKLLGSLYGCLPISVGGIKLSHLIFPLPTAPLGVLVFFWQKVCGQVYVLTNRSIRFRSALGPKLHQKVPLQDIADVVVDQKAGQDFYPAADLILVGKKGETLAVLAGVPRADVFRQSILEARNARVQTEASLATIKARGN